MDQPRKPTAAAIQLADTTAVAHVNAGLELYRQFEAMSLEQQPLSAARPANRRIELGIAALTNLAVGVELLLKVHRFQVTGAYPAGHEIRELGGNFPPAAADNLRRIYQSIHDDPSVSKGVDLRFSVGTPADRAPAWPATDVPTYDAAIAYVGEIYPRWRRVYDVFSEDTELSVSFAPLYFLARTLHSAIREQDGGTQLAVSDGTFNPA